MSRASAQAARRHSSSGGAPSSRPARAHYAQPIVHKKGVFAQDAAVTSHARWDVYQGGAVVSGLGLRPVSREPSREPTPVIPLIVIART